MSCGKADLGIICDEEHGLSDGMSYGLHFWELASVHWAG